MKRLLPLLLFVPGIALAWTPPANSHIAQKSAMLAPPDLRLLIEKFTADYESGVETATDAGNLRQRIEKETSGIIRMLRSNQPMPAVVERLGILAHLVADANNPLRVDPGLAAVGDDYEHYFERKLTLFPTVFYGLDPDFRLGPYLDQTFARSSRFAPLVHEEYFGDGEAHTSDDFDDLSTAFGVASVSYSHAVTDLVNLYYYIWKEAGGDVRSASVMRGGNLLFHEN